MKKNVCLILVALTLLSAINLSSQWIDKGKYKEVGFDIISNNFSIQNNTIIRDSWIDFNNQKSIVTDLDLNSGIIIDSTISDFKNILKNSYSIGVNNSDGFFYIIGKNLYIPSTIYYFLNKGIPDIDSSFLYDPLMFEGNTGVSSKNMIYKYDTLTSTNFFLFSYTGWHKIGESLYTNDSTKLISCKMENNRIKNLKLFNFVNLNTNFIFSRNKDEIICLSNYMEKRKINSIYTNCRIKGLSSYNLIKKEYIPLSEKIQPENNYQIQNNCLENIMFSNTTVYSFNSFFILYNSQNNISDSVKFSDHIEYFTLYNSSPIAFVKSGKNFYITNILLGNKLDSLTFDSDFNIEQYKWVENKLFLSCSDGKLRCFDINSFNFNKIDFSANKLITYTQNEINFIPISNKKINEIQWDFGDGNFSNQLNPEHTYEIPGQYTVSLIINDGTKSDTIIKKDYIEIIPPLKCDFTSDVTKGLPPLNVQFENLSSGNILNYEWDFGDSVKSTEQNPNHTYISKGYYHVSLKVTDAIYSIINEKDFYINCDTTNFKVLIEQENLCLYSNDNILEIEPVIELPLHGSDIYPGTDAIYYYYLRNHVREYPNNSFLQESLLLLNINNRNMTIKEIGFAKEWYNDNPLKVKEIAYKNLYMHNFYPDSCNFNNCIFSQSIYPLIVSAINKQNMYLYPEIKPDDTLRKFARMYNSKTLSISSINYFPVQNNKSVITVYNKKDTIYDNHFDITFKQINFKKIDGNIVNFEKINNNEFIAPITYFKTNKNIIDIIKINALGDIISKNSFPTSYLSLYLHHFIKLNDNEFIGCGVSGDSVTLGKGYLVAIDANGNLIKEITFDNDVVNFKKLIRFNDNEFAALFDTKSENKGYYVLDNNLNIKTNYRFKAKNYEITDFFITSEKKLKFLVVNKINKESETGIIKSSDPCLASLITTMPENEIKY